jgi:hypothetical protein
MECDSQEQAMILKFLKRNSIQIAIGLTLLAAVCCGMLLWTPNQRDERIARRIRSIGGIVSFEDDRINHIGISNKQVPSDVLAAIKTISTLKELGPSGFSVGRPVTDDRQEDFSRRKRNYKSPISQ